LAVAKAEAELVAMAMLADQAAVAKEHTIQLAEQGLTGKVTAEARRKADRVHIQEAVVAVAPVVQALIP
jgi:hypothetical protein